MTDAPNQLSRQVADAKSGDAKALNAIIEFFTPKITSLIGSFSIATNERDDVCQECLIALCDAVNGYNDNMGTEFATYANVCIRNCIISSIRKLNRKKNRNLANYVSLDQSGEDDSPDTYILPTLSGPEEQLVEKESYESFLSFADSVLTSLEKRIFELYILGYSYHEISDALKKPVKSVDNAVYRIRTKLRSEMKPNN